MKFSYNWLKDYVPKLPSAAKLVELLTMHSFEVEEVKKAGKDWVLDIDVLPNRAHDCFCHFGLAREIGAITNRKLTISSQEKLKTIKSKLKPINLKIQSPQLVPRYSAIVIEDIKVSQSPSWLKEKLAAVGIRSINNIVDLTNFVMLETGQPLHAFDYDKITEQKMILRSAKKGEKVVTLDGVKRNLDNGMLVIEDKKQLIDLVGIMGGQLSEIDSKTTNIVLQAGNFDRTNIYQTTKKLNHSTDASAIYTQGIDPNLTIPTLERTYSLLKKLGGGKIVQLIDIYPKKVLPKKLKLNLDYVEKLLGVKVPPKEIKNILQRLGLKIGDCKLQIINLSVPTFRLDISIPEDLIEEIGRIYGYQKIPAEFPSSSLVPPKINEQRLYQRKVSDILIGLGLSQTLNYSFIGEKDYQAGSRSIELLNPISKDKKYLRPTLLINLLKNVKENLKYFKEVRLFEIGKIFNKNKRQKIKDKKHKSKIKNEGQEIEIKEKNMLGGVISRAGSGEKLFYELKGVIDALLAQLGMAGVWYDDYQPSPEDSSSNLWRKGHSAEIKLDGEELGFLGQVNPQILSKFSIKESVVAFDIDWERLINLASEERLYRPPSKFPALVRDMAVLVNPNDKVEQVLNVINREGGPLLVDVDLFDFYMGEGIEKGKKSLAFHLVFQSETRSLSDREINEIQKKILEALEEKGWKVRR